MHLAHDAAQRLRMAPRGGRNVSDVHVFRHELRVAQRHAARLERQPQLVLPAARARACPQQISSVSLIKTRLIYSN
jgi:hypothetical protein